MLEIELNKLNSKNFIRNHVSSSLKDIFPCSRLRLRPSLDAHNYGLNEDKSTTFSLSRILHRHLSYNAVCPVLLKRYLRAFIREDLHLRIAILLTINLCLLLYQLHLAILQLHPSQESKW